MARFQRVYVRVSTTKQDLERQWEAIKGLLIEGSFSVYEEKITSKGGTKRPALERVMNDLQEGDEVVVHAIDRFGRDTFDFCDNVRALTAKKCTLFVAGLGMRFDDSPISKLTMTIMIGVAQIERDLISERVKGGMQIAKRKGKLKGRKPVLQEEHIQFIIERRSKGEAFAVIGDKLGVSRVSAYNALKRYENGTFNLNKSFWDSKELSRT